MWKTISIITLVALPLLAAVLGTAASLNIISVGDIFTASSSAAGCDGDGFVVSSTTTNVGGEITSVTISDIADTCLNGTAAVQLSDSFGGILGAGKADITVLSGPADDNSVDVLPTDDGTPSGSLILQSDVVGTHPWVTGGTITINPVSLSITIEP